MKLSIGVIYEAIQTPNSRLITNQPAAIEIKGGRIYHADSGDLSADLLYLISAEQIKDLASEKNLHVLCIGDCALDSLKNFASVIIMPEETNPAVIFAQVQLIFEQYTQWMEEVHQAIFENAPLQSILDLSSRFLRNPIALFDNFQSLLMKSGEMPGELGGSLWDFVLKHGYSPKEAESNFLTQKFLTNTEPFYYQSNDQYRNINRLLTSVFLGQNFFGCLAMSDINAPISETEYTNMCFIKSMIENALLNSLEYKTYTAEIPWYLFQLLNGRSVEKSVIAYQLSLIGKKITQPYFLWLFTPVDQTRDEKGNLSDYLTSITHQFQSEIVFCFENTIVVCDYQLNNHDNPIFNQKLEKFLSNVGLKAAYSMVFDHFLHIHQAFIQCKLVLDQADFDLPAVFNFKQNYAKIILSTLKNNIELKGLLYPGIEKLLEADQSYGQELLRCLQAYIFNNRNISAAAKNLYVHRHTVLYRMDRIQAITRIDFQQLTEDELIQIYLTCRILLD